MHNCLTQHPPDLKGKYYTIEKDMIDTFYAKYMFEQYGVEVGYKMVPWQLACMRFELANWQISNDCGTLCTLSRQ